MPVKRDYYQILGVEKSSSLDAIRKAYREAALRYHPDRVPAEQKKEAEEKLKEISEAYAVLSDAEKRALYHQYGHAGINQRYSHEDIYKGTDFSSIFGDLSDFGFGEGLFDTMLGGLGVDFFGRGRRQRTPSLGRDLQMTVQISLEEAAQGIEKKVTFYRDNEIKNISVKIPPGVDTGSTLRLKGEGEEGPGGRGNLYLVVEIAPHPLFERQGNDLLTEV